MDIVKVIIALALPWLVGSLLIHALVPRLEVGRRALVLGYGYLAGVLVVTLLMRGLNAVGFSLDLGNLLTLVIALIAIGAMQAYRSRQPLGGVWLSKAYLKLPLWQKIVTAVLLGLVAFRLGGFWLEVYWRPLYPWDAFMHWATKARVWTDAQAILPFVDYDQWLALRGEGVFTDNHPDYPITTPLLQTWMNLILGRWDDALMNLPWPLLALAGGLAFFGQARLAGVGPLAAVFFTYILLSLPLLNMQVALAGYADIFMGIFYLGAVMAFYLWSISREVWQGALALVFALSCLLIKNEGLFWLLVFAPGLVALFMPRRWFWLVAGLGLVAVMATLAFIPTNLEVAGHTLARLNLHYRADALIAFLQSLFVFANWHLLFWLTGGLLLTRLLTRFVAGPTHPASWPNSLFAVGILLGTAFILLSVLFLFTNYSGGAIRHTAVTRISLQLVPSLTFFTMLLYKDLTSPSHIPALSVSIR